MTPAILIVDDHEIVRKGLHLIIRDELMGCQVTEAGSAEEGFKLAGTQRFDLVITDISLPGRSGLELTAQLRQAFPTLPILVLSIHPEDQYAIRALRLGASGYLGKNSVSLELSDAIRKLLSGRKYISPQVGELLAGNLNSGKADSMHSLLSDREFDVMRLIGSGLSVSEIAVKLALSVPTISTYRQRILEKTGFHSNADIIRYSILHDIL